MATTSNQWISFTKGQWCGKPSMSWHPHIMELSNPTFLLALCEGNPLVTVESPHEGPVMRKVFPVIILDTHNIYPVLKIRTICHAQENWLCLANSYIYNSHQTHEIFQVLPYSVDFKAPRELWNPLIKTVLSKCSFIWNKGYVKIWNTCKTQK